MFVNVMSYMYLPALQTWKKSVIKQHCVPHAPLVDFILCPTNQPTLLRGKVMEKQAFCGDGLSSEALQYQSYTCLNRLKNIGEEKTHRGLCPLQECQHINF